MDVVSRLQRQHEFQRSFSEKCYAVSDEFLLAARAAQAELRHGAVTDAHRLYWLPRYRYVAMIPVAPHIEGTRKAGFAASGYWGASVAVSALRHDAATLYPVMVTVQNAYVLLRYILCPMLPIAPLAAAVGVIASTLAVGGHELVFGTGRLDAPEHLRHAHRNRVVGDTSVLRTVGMFGQLEANLVGAAERATRSQRHVFAAVCLGAAVLVNAACVLPRLAGAAAVGAIASLGCIFGLGYECCAQANFALRMWWERGEARPLADVVAARPGPDQPDHLADMHRRHVNVQDRGRVPNTMDSLRRLRALCPFVAHEACIDALREEILRQRRNNTPLSRQRHESGAPLLDAAEGALGRGGPRIRPSYPAILAAENTLSFYDGEVVSVAHVLSLVWHTIERLSARPRTKEARQRIRQERKDALLRALASCITENSSRVCSDGQAQRMLLVLQGYVKAVEIDHIERIPTVNELVPAMYPGIVAALGEAPPAQSVQARFDAAYREGGQRLPQAQHAALMGQLAELAQLDFNHAWQPVA